MTVFSRFATNREIRENLKKTEKIWPPPIPFLKKSKKPYGKASAKSKDGSDEDEESAKYCSVNIKFDPTDDDSEEYKRKIIIFKNGTPEDWCDFRRTADCIFKEMHVKNNAEKKKQYFSAFLDEKPRLEMDRAYDKYSVISDDTPITELAEPVDLNVALERALNDVAKKFFEGWETAVRKQKSYMRKNLFMGNMDPEKFFDRVEKINDDLPYFPTRDGRRRPHKLDIDELIDIADSAKKMEWHLIMMSQGRRPDTFETLEEAKEYYKALYAADQLRQVTQKSEGNTGKNKRGKKRGANDSDKKKSHAVCSHCGKPGHKSDECWTLDKNKKKRPRHFKTGKKEKTYTKEETVNMMNMMWSSMRKKTVSLSPSARSLMKWTKTKSILRLWRS